MELFLIRHAETDCNKNKRYCSFTDVGLNEKGKEQASALQDKMKDFSVDEIFCSPYQRTQETANLIFPETELEMDPALRELNFGKWEGLNYDEIVQNYGDLYSQWLFDPYLNKPPQGEALGEVEDRVFDFLQRIYKQYGEKKIACVSHAGPLKVMICQLLNKGKKDFWKFSVSNASVSYFKCDEKGVLSYNINLL
ncbi:MAG: histidine phosphatase family protein [PVC group bacterium]|nr:histidine phosphatase family protein [PVC group bacterium]